MSIYPDAPFCNSSSLLGYLAREHVDLTWSWKIQCVHWILHVAYCIGYCMLHVVLDTACCILYWILHVTYCIGYCMLHIVLDTACSYCILHTSWSKLNDTHSLPHECSFCSIYSNAIFCNITLTAINSGIGLTSLQFCSWEALEWAQYSGQNMSRSTKGLVKRSINSEAFPKGLKNQQKKSRLFFSERAGVHGSPKAWV